jgi:hypothetical protein
MTYTASIERAITQVALSLSSLLINSIVLFFERGHLRSFRAKRKKMFRAFGFPLESSVVVVTDNPRPDLR